MMRTVAAALLAPVVAWASLAAAQVAPAPPPVQPSASAARVAQVLTEEEIVVSQTARVLRDQVPRALASNPQFQEMEKRSPGLIAEFVQVMEPIVLAYVRRSIPAYRTRVAALFERRMSPVEMDATAAFFASPTGRRVQLLAADGTDFGDMMKRQIDTGGKAEIKAEEIRAALLPGVQGTLTKLTGEELKQLVAFGLSPAGIKLNGINPELQQLAAANGNVNDPAVGAEIGKAVMALMARRLGGKPKE